MWKRSGGTLDWAFIVCRAGMATFSSMSLWAALKNGWKAIPSKVARDFSFLISGIAYQRKPAELGAMQ